jgi:NADPH2:quinone reductase
VPSAPIRGKLLVIMGHSNFAAPPEVKREAYMRLAGLAGGGELRVEVQPYELERVAEAWEQVVAGAHRKIVLVP